MRGIYSTRYSPRRNNNRRKIPPNLPLEKGGTIPFTRHDGKVYEGTLWEAVWMRLSADTLPGGKRDAPPGGIVVTLLALPDKAA